MLRESQLELLTWNGNLLLQGGFRIVTMPRFTRYRTRRLAKWDNAHSDGVHDAPQAPTDKTRPSSRTDLDLPMASPSLDILYHKGPCLVVNKPAGLLTQAPAGIDSLEEHVKAFYRQHEAKEGNMYLGLPHRLDRPVSGAIVFARHARAAQRIATQFEHRTVTKMYWAVVEGEVQPAEGAWTDYLHKRHGMAQSIVVAADDPRGKIAILHYRVLARLDGVGTWLEVQLETGRTHQIRIQCASRGHAVLGDAQYGATQPFGEQFEDERLRAIALHARQLAFRHPMLDELVDVTAPLSAAWNDLKLPVEILRDEPGAGRVGFFR